MDWENVSLQAELNDVDDCPPGTFHIHDDSRWPCTSDICQLQCGGGPLGGVVAWFDNEPGCTSSNTRLPSSIGLMNMTNLNDPDPRPMPGSEPLTAGVAWTHPYLQDSFFDQTPTYRGAFDPDLPMYAQWTRCWSNFNPQFTDYDDGAGPTAVGDGVPEMDDVVLENRPNPFNPTTTIRFSVPTAGHVTIQVFNVRGELVATVLDREMAADTYEEVFNATGLATGTYFYRIAGNGFTKTAKMVLLK
jgi:hypothetical protein